jgi:hypothetical protein
LTDEGIETDSSDGQESNVDGQRVDSFEPGSNVKLERDRHHLKQEYEVVSSDEGIQIDRRDGDSENAKSPRIEI